MPRFRRGSPRARRNPGAGRRRTPRRRRAGEGGPEKVLETLEAGTGEAADRSSGPGPPPAPPRAALRGGHSGGRRRAGRGASRALGTSRPAQIDSGRDQAAGCEAGTPSQRPRLPGRHPARRPDRRLRLRPPHLAAGRRLRARRHAVRARRGAGAVDPGLRRFDLHRPGTLDAWRADRRRQPRRAAVTLPELLHGAGYRTTAFSTNGNVSPETGMGQGFDEFFLEMAAPRSSEVTPRVLAWLDAHASPKPFFLYVHTADPHAPYEPSRRTGSGSRRGFARKPAPPEI